MWWALLRSRVVKHEWLTLGGQTGASLDKQ